MTDIIDRKQARLLKIDLNSTSMEGVLREIRLRLGKISKDRFNKYRFLIVTPNPEIVLISLKDQKLRKIINKAQISIPDGVGLAMAKKFISLKSPKTQVVRFIVCFFQGVGVGLALFVNKKWLESGLKVLKGREVFSELIKLANKKGWRVALLGDRMHSAQKAAHSLKMSYKKIQIVALDGPNLDQNAKVLTQEDERVENEAVMQINQFKPHLLFVGFGSPRQEKWSARWINKLNVGGVMVVGKTFQWVSGEAKQAPQWVGNIGLEWLWRLLTGSTNLRRIINALFIFPLRVFVFKLKQNKD